MSADGPLERRLILLRHAKAKKSGPSDHERGLAERGHQDATEVGRRMHPAGLRPQRAKVSTSLRTRQTWQLVAAELESPPKEELESAIYDNEVEGLLELVRATPDDIGSLLIVGHNPSIEELAGQLDDAGGDPVIRHRMADGFPTSGYAVLTTSDSWRAVGPGTLRLESFVTPRG